MPHQPASSLTPFAALSVVLLGLPLRVGLVLPVFRGARLAASPVAMMAAARISMGGERHAR